MEVQSLPCPSTGSRAALQWPCGRHETAGTACCGEDAQRADDSCQADQPQCSPAFSFAHHNQSSHRQSEGRGTVRIERACGGVRCYMHPIYEQDSTYSDNTTTFIILTGDPVQYFTLK